MTSNPGDGGAIFESSGEDGCGCSENRPDEAVIFWQLEPMPETHSITPDSADHLSIGDASTDEVMDSDDVSDYGDEPRWWHPEPDVEVELLSDDFSIQEPPFVLRRRRRARTSSGSPISSSDLEAIVAVLAAVIKDGFCVAYFADSSSDMSDPELEPEDKWSCLKCKQKNHPIQRYCWQCFAVRKKWFPPKPRRHRKNYMPTEHAHAEKRKNQSHSISPPASKPRLSPGCGTQSLSHPEASTLSIPQTSPSNPSFSENNMLSDNPLIEHTIDTFLTAVKNFKGHQKEIETTNIEISQPETLTSTLDETLGNIKDTSIKSQRQTFIDPNSKNSGEESLTKQTFQSSVGEDVVNFSQNSTEYSNFCPARKEVVNSPEISKSDVVVTAGISEACIPSSPLDSSVQSLYGSSRDGSQRSLPTIPSCSSVDSSPRSFLSETITSPSNSSPDPSIPPRLPGPGDKMCVVCQAKVADTAFTHGRIAHKCACFSCAKKVFNSERRCPMCEVDVSSYHKIYIF